MTRYILTTCLCLFAALAQAQMRWNQAYQQYINQYKDLAIEQMLKYNIPASITLAQGLFESRAGLSVLATKGNNHFGIKCHGWQGRAVYHDDDARNECFRAYRNAYESYEDHSRFLAGGQRYRKLFSLKVTDYKGWAHGLRAAGYATNPQYAKKLIEIIQLYKLHEFDKARKYDKFFARRSKDIAGKGGVLHQVFEFNNNYYVKARRGDTFRTIAAEVGISYRSLAKYNERNRKDILEEGEIIYLKKKRTKAPKSYKGRLHYVKPGESMYSIAQLYGIRLANLYKMNGLSPDYQIRVGDGLRLR
ncbi:glucosaminidase domain-containing protein [Bacteroides caecimuris]|uniref:glucosaminidase domain-containing protein n=1 Tax=Bacteroides caecimuris TaxID=1796613 RepID=UPI0026F15BAF|nr:glucosaminidase domain-containing protein [Bacteroides caecimuris]